MTRVALANIAMIVIAEDLRMILPIGRFEFARACVALQSRLMVTVRGLVAQTLPFLLGRNCTVAPTPCLCACAQRVIRSDPSRWDALLTADREHDDN